MGAWVTYGLGTENQNLPAFVVLPDFRSLPFSGSQQWGSGFLPASYQGTVLRWKGDPILDLKPPASVTAGSAGREMELLRSYQPGVSAARHFTNPGSAGPHRFLRTGLSHAGRGPWRTRHRAGEPEATAKCTA